MKFWMVYVEGEGSPTKRHNSLEEAEKEAERLARLEEKSVYVLEAVQVCEVKAVHWAVLAEKP